MTKEDKQIIDRAVKEEWRIGDRTRLKRLLKKNLEQYRDKVELENEISDIKANCDLAIEGRDVRIMELEKDNKLLEQRGSDILKELLDKNKRCIELEESNKELQKLVQQREQRGLEVQEDLLKEKAELEKENAELKKKIGIYQKGMYDEIEKRDKKLTKAKEIIKTFLQLRNGNVLDCCKNKECPWENPLCETIDEQAEQFVKENGGKK